MIQNQVPGYQDAEFRQAMLAAIVESSDDAIISKTLQGIITSWNAAAKRLFGYEEQEVLGKHISILLPEDRLSEEDVIIREIINGNRIDHFQTKRRRKDGTEIDISLTISPVRNKNNEIIGASKIARDISLQVATEAKLMIANMELQKSNMYKDDFIGLLGHELRTPLAGIKACVQLISEVPERTPELLQKADRQINRMTTLLVELVDFAKSQAGRLEIAKTQNIAQDFISNAIEIVQQGQTSHRIEFNNDIPSVSVMADALRMEQVVINLLTNAVK
ncbi:MAG: PAS domain-containing sensor histidine kinase, partial [Chitinophagaceae bacterium]